MSRVLGFVPLCLALAAAMGATVAAQNPRPNETGSSVGTGQQRQFPVALIHDQCIEFTELKRGNDSASDFRDCKVSEAGQFGSAGERTYYYALYCLIPSWADDARCGDDSFTARYNKSRALAIFARDGAAENLQLLYERATPEIGTLLYKKPEIIQGQAGTLLYIPIGVDGTGAGNESEYFQLGTKGWEPIEANEWLKDLQDRLPAGLQIWKGVWPDLKTMQAEAGLYREHDGNCCPTGGTARIQLAIRSGHFVIVSVAIDKAP